MLLQPIFIANMVLAFEWLPLRSWRCFCSLTHGHLLLGDRGTISITLPPPHRFLSSISDVEPMYSSTAAQSCSPTLRIPPTPTVDSAELLAISLIRTWSTSHYFQPFLLPLISENLRPVDLNHIFTFYNVYGI